MLYVFGAAKFTPKFDVIPPAIPVLLKGAWFTILVTLFGVGIGFLIGIVMGLARTSKNVFVYTVSTWYIEFIRGTPLLVQLFFIFFGVGMFFNITGLQAAILGISLNSGAYIAEIVRGGIQSIERGQMEAGRSLGMTYLATMRHIIWPQAFRRIIPPLGNQFIISLKDTSLLSVIAVPELTRRGQIIIATNFRAFEIWAAVAVVYLIMTLSISVGLQKLEKKLNIPG
ncbi:MAG: amino acid ABC transporter permease [Clostridia bacterium]|nr:amino acid ABC transporter permease [Clostridia bacterium]